MNTLSRNLFAIFCFIVTMTACSNQAMIRSATSDKVVVKAQPEQFVNAYHMAQKECQKHTKNADYIPDDTAGLDVVAFNCIGEEIVAEAASEEAPEETEASTTEIEEAPEETGEVPSE